MSSNHHIPIANAAPVNAAIVNAALAGLDDSITKYANANKESSKTKATKSEIGRLRYQAPAAAIGILSGVLRVNGTRTRIIMDTEGLAPSDVLERIEGAAVGDLNDGDVLYLQIANNSRPITIANGVTDGVISGTLNIALQGQANITLVDTNQILAVMYDSTNGICRQIDPSPAFRQLIGGRTFARTWRVPEGSIRAGDNAGEKWLDVLPGFGSRITRAIVAAAATFQAIGLAAPTISGAAAEANQTNSVYVQLTSAGAAALAGINSATFDLARTAYNPVLETLIRTPSDITNLRGWVGLASASIGNADAAGATQFVGFRFSTVAGDTGWTPYTSSGSAVTIGTVMGGELVANTPYKLSIFVDGNGTAYFSVNDSARQVIAATMPATTTEMGYLNYMIGTSAAKVYLISRLYLSIN